MLLISETPIGKLLRYTCDGKQCWSRVGCSNGDPIYISAHPEMNLILIKKSNMGILGDKLFELNAKSSVILFMNVLMYELMTIKQNKKFDLLEIKHEWTVPADMVLNAIHLAIFTEIALHSYSADSMERFIKQIISKLEGKSEQYRAYYFDATYNIVRKLIVDTFRQYGVPC